MTDLLTWARNQPGRCPQCGFHLATQGCACEGQRLKFERQADVLAAHPDDRSKVEAAIRQLARTGRPFSANDARKIHGVSGGVVGAAFTALHKAKVIRPVGDEVSTQKRTHGHRIFQWVGAAA